MRPCASQLSGRGKTSGLEVGQMAGYERLCFRFYDGKVANRVANRAGRERALADRGVSREGDASG